MQACKPRRRLRHLRRTCGRGWCRARGVPTDAPPDAGALANAWACIVDVLKFFLYHESGTDIDQPACYKNVYLLGHHRVIQPVRPERPDCDGRRAEDLHEHSCCCRLENIRETVRCSNPATIQEAGCGMASYKSTATFCEHEDYEKDIANRNIQTHADRWRLERGFMITVRRRRLPAAIMEFSRRDCLVNQLRLQVVRELV
jgi:hypothetical protein